MTPADDNIEGFDRPDQTMLVDVPKQLGIYTLSRLLGRGGMGEVWLGFDTKLERNVAVKLMRRELLTNEEAVKRFYREARAVARLNHPNIVQAYSIGEEQSLIYYVMEMVEGETVTERLKRLGPLPLDDAINIMLQTINGLDFAHARGVVHRDIKPSNIMLTNEFRVKIADFGLAKLLEGDTQMTASGVAMGSPNYMSPEQARGEEADHRSDIYALGITLYQTLTGELPFTAPTPITVLLRQIQDQLPEPEQLRGLADGRVLDVIKKMTAKSPEDRFQTYGGLAAALSAIAPNVHVARSGHSPTTTLPAPTGEPAADDARTPAPSPAATDTLPADATPRLVRRSDGASARPAWVAPAAMVGSVLLLGVLGALAVYLLLPKPQEPTSAMVDFAPPQGAPPAAPGASGAPSVATPAGTPAPPLTATATPAATQAAAPVAQQATPAQAAPATPVVAPLMTPPPTPIVATTNEVIVGPDLPPGAPVQLLDEQGAPAGTVAAGTRMPLVRMVAHPDGARYVVRSGNAVAMLPSRDARPVTATGPTAPASGGSTPAATPRGLRVVLGTQNAKPGQTIVVYADRNLKRELVRLEAGEELPATEEPPLGYRVVLPDNRSGYVVKGDARVMP